MYKIEINWIKVNLSMCLSSSVDCQETKKV